MKEEQTKFNINEDDKEEVILLSNDFSYYFIKENICNTLNNELNDKSDKVNKTLKVFDELNKENAYIENLYLRARLGEEVALSELYKILVSKSKCIAYSYKNSTKTTISLGIDELESLFNVSYEKFIQSDEFFFDCCNFFKFLYIQDINQLIRKFAHKELKNINDKIQESLNNDEISLDDSKVNNFNSDSELYEKIINDKRSKLDEIEKYILMLIINSFSIKEISEKIHICYTQSRRKVERVKQKVRIYIEKYLPGIIKEI